MKTYVVSALVAAALAAPYAPARADHGPQGLLCGFASVTDPGTEGGDVQTGEIDGGPVLVAGDGTVTCSIQVGDALCGAVDHATATGGGTSVAYLPPTPVSYVSPADTPVYLCTAVTDATGSYYWDDRTGDWVPDPDAAHGVLSTSASVEDVDDWADDWLSGLYLIDCPVLALLFPPQGDIPGIWDCPPYGM